MFLKVQFWKLHTLFATKNTIYYSATQIFIPLSDEKNRYQNQVCVKTSQKVRGQQTSSSQNIQKRSLTNAPFRLFPQFCETSPVALR